MDVVPLVSRVHPVTLLTLLLLLRLLLPPPFRYSPSGRSRGQRRCLASPEGDGRLKIGLRNWAQTSVAGLEELLPLSTAQLDNLQKRRK